MCPLFGICGGCDLWELPYSAQLDYKKETLYKLLSQALPGVKLPDIAVVPSVPFEYRSRIELHRLDEAPPARREKKIRAGLADGIISKAGFMAKKSRSVIPVNDCPIAVPQIRTALRAGLFVPPPDKDRWTVLATDSTLLSEGGGAQWKNRGKMRLLDRELYVDAGVFFQSNIALFEQMIADVCLMAKDMAGKTAWDLYCGAGIFAAFLHDNFSRLVLMEANKSALNLARENVPQTECAVEFYAFNDKNWVNEMRKRKKLEKPAFVLVDPPRSGLSPALIQFLNEIAPSRLVYVSCYPNAFSTDAKTLVAGGFTLANVTFYDFYPQTRHIESVALFTGR